MGRRGPATDESTVDSTFSEWPAPAGAADAAEDTARPRQTAPALLRSLAPEAARGRVLLVEDRDDFRELLAELLALEGYAVDAAANGQEGCRRLERPPLPDLILLDLMMPVMNGWGFLNARQKDPALAAIPVIVFSAISESEAIVDAERVVTCLTKPFAFEELLALKERHRKPPR
jgi:CheY-like chemotaxis protein